MRVRGSARHGWCFGSRIIAWSLSLCALACGTEASTHNVSGTVSGGTPGVTVSLFGGGVRTFETTSSGRYWFGYLPDGEYTISPWKPGYTFSPAVRPVSLRGVDIGGQDFTGTPTPGAGWQWQGTSLAYLDAMWGSGPGDVWAVGAHGAVLHWDGNAWAARPSAATSYLKGIWGSGPSDVWAVGAEGAILHWDGSAWATASSGTRTWLKAVWGSGPSDVWAVGDFGTALHWNGAAWTAVPAGTPDGLEGIWGNGPSDVWAVGGAPGFQWPGLWVPSHATLLHWDGSTWATVSSGTTAWLHAIWGSGPKDVWVVGGDYEDNAILHWDGSAWAAVSSWTRGGYAPQAVWGSGPSDVWIVGDNATLHWDGFAWAAMPLGFNAIWGSGASDVWAVSNSEIWRWHP